MPKGTTPVASTKKPAGRHVKHTTDGDSVGGAPTEALNYDDAGGGEASRLVRLATIS